jgi:hypothetical protein
MRATSRSAAGSEHLIHFGAIYKLAPHQQFDIHGGIGLSSAGPAHFIGFGYSLLTRCSR